MLELGIAGGGAIAGVYLDAATAGGAFRVRALADRDPDVLAKRREETRGLALYDDVAALLLDPDIDVLVVALPHDLHAQTAVAALKAGKHVICEKPLGLSLEEARRVADAEAHSVGRAVVRCYLRALDHHQWLHTMVQDGELGAVALLRGLFASDRREALRDQADWHGDWRRAGGGVTIDAGYHFVDLARHLLGEVDSVSAEMRRTYDGADDSEDVCALTLRHTAGAVTSAAFIWCDDLRPFRWEREVYASKGVVFVDDVDGRSNLDARIRGEDPVRRSLADWWRETNHQAVLDCVAALAPGGTFGGGAVGCTEAIESLQLVLAAYLSAERGESIAPSAVRKEYRPAPTAFFGRSGVG
jgi:predicted dehydrogenase